jgi:hypothetical protein
MAGVSSGLSDGFVYRKRPVAAPAAAIEISVPPFAKGRFTKGNQKVMFNIPSGKRGQYLNTRMSFLEFKLRVDAVNLPHVKNVTPAESYNPILKLDGGAHSFFKSLQVFHGSNLLEYIDQYNSLYQLLSDQGQFRDEDTRTIAEGRGFTSKGVTEIQSPRDGIIVSPWVINTDTAFTGTTATYAPVTSGNPVDDLTFLKTATSIDRAVYAVRGDGTGTSYTSKVFTFCIPIVSGIVGAQMPRYLPVGALAADVRLEFDLASFDQAFSTVGCFTGNYVADPETGNPSFTNVKKNIAAALSSYGIQHEFELFDFELKLEYVEVAADVQSAIEGWNKGQYTMSFDSWSTFTNTINGNQQALTQLIGSKLSSVKDLTTTFRPSAFQDNVLWSGITSRVDPFSSEPNRTYNVSTFNGRTPEPYLIGHGWQYQIGATFYPPRPVDTNQQAWMEALKNMHAVTAANQSGLFNSQNWSTSARAELAKTNNVNVFHQNPGEGGTYYVTQNLESQAHKSNLCESGVNTLAQTVYLSLRMPGQTDYKTISFHPTAGDEYGVVKLHTSNQAEYLSLANVEMLIDTFAHYDAVLVIRNGLMNTRF